MLLTFVLAISIIGWIILLSDFENVKNKSTWMCIGHSMCNDLLQNNVFHEIVNNQFFL